jgi:hypothetical protein
VKKIVDVAVNKGDGVVEVSAILMSPEAIVCSEFDLVQEMSIITKI